MRSPGTKNWQAMKRLFRYLSGTRHLGLFYPKGGSLPPDLHAFSDSDWAGCYDTRTSGFCFMLGNSCISWLSKKQPTVATSSCEAEYRAAFTAMVECVWLKRLVVADLGVGHPSATTIFTDDSHNALAVARNPVFHARTKHIEVHYHYVRERLSAVRSVWHMCQHRITLLKFETFQLWAYYHLWIDHPYGQALPYTLSASSCSQHHF